MKALAPVGLAGCLLLACPVADAAPPVPAAAPSGVTRVVLENDRVRAHRIDYPPGSRTPEHTHHDPRVVVVLEGGTLEIRGADGVKRTMRVAAGDVVWRPAEKHAIVNPGSTTVSLVEVDILACR